MNTEIANKLVLLNGFRKELGLTDLITWSKSDASLELAIAKAQEEVMMKAKARREAKANEEINGLLDRLNGHYAVMGVKELKAWNGTVDELRAAIRQAKADHKDLMDAEKKEAKVVRKPVTLAPVVSKKLTAKVIASKAKKETKAKVAAAPVAEQGLLPRIAADLGINPKIARAKLRKKFGSDWRNLNEKEVRAALA